MLQWHPPHSLPGAPSHQQKHVNAHMGAKHTKMSIKLIESGLTWHRESKTGNKIKVLINCGFRPLSGKELRVGARGSHSLKGA